MIRFWKPDLMNISNLISALSGCTKFSSSVLEFVSSFSSFFFFWKASNEHIFLLEIVTPFLLFKNWKNNVRGGDIGVPKMYIRLLLNIILY